MTPTCSFAPILLEDSQGIDRDREPVTFGIPLPQGLVSSDKILQVVDPGTRQFFPVQAEPLARWPDGSIKWVLLDFFASLNAHETKNLHLTWKKDAQDENSLQGILSFHDEETVRIDTGAAQFHINTKDFKPFDRIIFNGTNALDESKSNTILTDANGVEFKPVIKKIFIETPGHLRTTIRMEGRFQAKSHTPLASFFARLSFFHKSALVKIDFTILNPRAAKHTGGLWDLGDPGSIFFKDLSIDIAIPDAKEIQASLNIIDEWKGSDKLPKKYPTDIKKVKNLQVYQDSSGGENWMSRNHVNKDGEVKNTFQGFRVYQNGGQVMEGKRAAPIVALSSAKGAIAAAIQNFWQNFPKALGTDGATLKLHLFPEFYNDLYELQGGEQKTHTVYLDFSAKKPDVLSWTRSPIIGRSTPAWYEKTAAIPYLVARGKDSGTEICSLIDGAIQGKNSFFERRETIDEYGWRNFGELYADHEAVGHKGKEPFISHYNNQYDGIYGSLFQFLCTGNSLWFKLGDELCHHVADIDIYHTGDDRPEYSHGMFWHTEHYIDAETATHRCFSKRHAGTRNLNSYGGGPSLSHNYSSGLLLHYYLTGTKPSKEAIEELGRFILSCLCMDRTLGNKAFKKIKNLTHLVKDRAKKQDLVVLNKVYGLEGPGRASGNALNTLLDFYLLMPEEKTLIALENLITTCIGLHDDIEARDLLDTENRWMYTVFLQALCKYILLKANLAEFDDHLLHARKCLLRYALWMKKKEHPYLDRPEKLEFPNETWAAQEFRKFNILLFASWCATDKCLSQELRSSAHYFFDAAQKQLLSFETKNLTRPLVLLLQNSSLYFPEAKKESITKPLGQITKLKEPSQNNRQFNFGEKKAAHKTLGRISLKNELLFLKWRICR